MTRFLSKYLFFLLPFYLFAASQDRDVSNFTSISVESNVVLWIEEASQESLKLEGTDNALANIETTVDNKVLTIRPKSNTQSAEKVQAYVTVKDLENLNISGNVTTTTQNQIKSSTFNFHASGNSVTNLDLDVTTLNISLAGQSKLKLTGRAKTQTINAAGSSDIDAQTFQTDNTTLNASGSAQIDVNATKTLDVTASGNAVIGYTGNPQVKKHLSGNAKVAPLKTTGKS
ncbi:MAG: hypothetical protein K940chlam8_00621 [Chlamydiae bacterium]|nr:hypothetical protein [Chlamydiota bacterium]